MQLFNGKLYIEPSSGVKIITSGAPTPNLLSTGVVGVIGESDGGLTYEDSAVYTATNPNTLKDILRGGKALRCINYIFNPSLKYPGATRVYFVRAQQATVAVATITQSTGGSVTFTITTVDKGLYLSDATNGLKWKLIAGTTDNTKEVLILQFQQKTIWTSPECATYQDLINALANDTQTANFVKGAVTSGSASTAIDSSVRTAVFAVFTGGTSPSMSGTTIDNAIKLLTNLNCNLIFLADETNTNHAKVVSFINNTMELPAQTFLGGAVNETKAQVKARAAAIDSEVAHICYPDIMVPTEDGTSTEKLSPMYLAAFITGLRAGLPSYLPLTWKTINVLSFVQNEGEFAKADREELITGGVLFCRNVPGVGLAVNKGVNTLQTNSSMIYKTATGECTSPESSIIAIKQLIIRELIVNSAQLFIGGTAATVSKEDVINFTTSYLKTRCSTATQPGLINSYGNVTAELVNDAWMVYFNFTPNTPINHVFYTGTMLKP